MRIRKRKPAHPGEIIQMHYLQPLNVSAQGLASALGVSKGRISQLLGAQTTITPDLALRLSRAFETSPELWLNLQSTYDLWQATQISNEWQKINTILLKGTPVTAV